ncbi:MAG TPA: folate-binding protein [Candidatus Competibacteraceae bacterium]|nr:folate-binding protein [Candidatus Competibacteraceae bacterium]
MIHPQWREFLQSLGARPGTDPGAAVEDFGDAAAERQAAVDGDVLCDLSPLALLAIAGADAVAFLQGQLTNDVQRVDASHSQLTAHCNPKGRMLFLGRLLRHAEEGLLLCLPQPLLDTALKRLRLYVLRAKVALADRSVELARLGVAGPQALARLAQRLGPLPEAADACRHYDGLSVVRLPGPRPRVMLIGPVVQCRSLWQELAALARPAGYHAWRLLDILAGLPSLHPTTVEAFVPQMVNLQLLNGVSFRKGCYTGQEIVARTEYLGKLKRRMYLARVASDEPPAPGSPLYSPQADPGQETGRVVDAVSHPAGGSVLLAVCLIACAEGGEVRLGGAAGPRLAFQPLPYPLPTGN